MKQGTAKTLAFSAALTMAWGVAPAGADPVADFYKGRQVQFVIGTGVGGSYDVNGRLLARHFHRHIPGPPAFVIQNVPGAGSRKAAAFVYSAAPQDGSVIAQLLNTLPLAQAMDQINAEFDCAQFQWIGNLSDDVSMVDVWHTAPAKTVEEARRVEVIMGATSATALGAMIPLAMNNVLGTRFRVVTGYEAGAQVDLAVERGEVHGRAGESWSVLQASRPQLLKEGKLVHLAQMGLRKGAGLEQVPLLTELARNEEERRIMEIISSPSSIGKPTVVGPKVPKEFVTALRRAYDATMRDPEFLADAQRQGLAIGPVSGDELQKIVVDTLTAPPEILAKVKAALEPPAGDRKKKSGQ